MCIGHQGIRGRYEGRYYTQLRTHSAIVVVEGGRVLSEGAHIGQESGSELRLDFDKMVLHLRL